MATSHKARRAPPIALDDEPGFPWLPSALGLSSLALLFEVFPAAWWKLVWFLSMIMSYIDVRGWTWRSYAVVCAGVIVALVFIKARQDHAD